MTDLLLLWLAAVALMGSPGPATLSLAAAGAAFGARAALPYLGGIVLGTTGVLLLIALGLTGALLAIPALGPVAAAAGGAYLLWLAWRIAQAPPPGAREAGARPPGFAPGLVLALLNPKAWAAFGAVWAGRSLVPGAPLEDAAAKLAALAPVVVVVNSLWLLFGAALAARLRDPRLGRAFNRALALLLVLSVGAIFLG